MPGTHVMGSDNRTGQSVGIVGAGRAGISFAAVLPQVGFGVTLLDRAQSTPQGLANLVESSDIILICVPDAAIGSVIGGFDSEALDSEVIFAHCSGVSGLDVLSPAKRRASIHPLVSLNGLEPERLMGAWFGLSGDDSAMSIVKALGGKAITVAEHSRALYHAASVIASNHTVALMAQVQAIAAALELPLEAFMDLASGSLESACRLGPATALTGPVSRGDFETVAAHLKALQSVGLTEEIQPYLAMARRAASLAGRDTLALDSLNAADAVDSPDNTD